MISLPPGCTVNYAIRIICMELTPEMVEWFLMIGGTAGDKEYYNHRGQRKLESWVAYGGAKPSSKALDGTGHTRLNFNGKDASVASMFLLKFGDDVVGHNLKEHTTLVY